MISVSNDRGTAISILIAFTLLEAALLLAVWNHLLIWDSSIYLAMGKYFFSGGSIGLLELTRPPLLPLLLGALWKIGLPAAGTRIVAILFSIIGVAGTYLMIEDLFGSNEAVYTILLIIGTQLFLRYNVEALTGIPAAFLLLASLYLVEKEHPLLAGSVASFAFLIRFPAALVAPAAVITLLVKGYVDGQLRERVRDSIFFSISFFIIALPFLIFNQIQHGNVLAPLLAGASYPALNPSTYQYGLYYLIQMTKNNPLLILAPLGLYASYRSKERSSLSFALAFLLIYGFFTIYSYKTSRYFLLFLPLAALFSSKAFTLVQKLWNPAKETLRILILIAAASVFLISATTTYAQHDYPVSSQKNDFYTEAATLTGTVAANDPVTAAYGDFTYVGLPPLTLERQYQKWKSKADFFAINSCAWYCNPAIDNCQQRIDNFQTTLQDEYIKQFHTTTQDCSYTIYRTGNTS